MPTIPETLQTALTHHQAGRLQEAEALYRQILQDQPDHADALHLLGVIAHQVGRHEAAVDCILKAIKFNPTVAEYHNNLGEAYRAIGKLEEAAAHYREALMLRPAFAEPYSNMSIVLRKQGKREEAAAHCRQALALKPAFAEAHNNLGNVLKDEGKLDEAVACYRQALALKPDYAEAHNNLGLSLQAQGKREEAVACYRQALVLKPDYAEAHNNLGNALQDQGRLTEAEASYRQALALKPDFAEAHSNLGNALRDQGRLTEAEASCRRALTLKPDFAAAHYNLGITLRDQGRLTEAEASYRRALALNPASAEAMNNLGAVLQAQGKLEEAVAHYRRALALKPDYAQAYNNVGSALLAQGIVEEAATYVRQALALSPSYAGAHNNLGIVLQQEGLLSEAIAEYRQALLHDRTLAEAHANLGSVLQEQGKTQEAIDAYRQAIAVNPAYADAYSMLGNALKKQSKPDEAAQAYQQALALQPGDGTRIKLATILPIIIGSKRELTAIRRNFETNISALQKEKLRIDDPAKEIGQTNFHLAYHGLNDRALQVKIAQLYERACPSLLYTAPHCRPSARIEKAGKAKIGFISRYFRNHSVAKAARGVLALLSRERFDVTAIFAPPVSHDETATFIRQHADHTVVLPLNLKAARLRIAEETFDILFYQDIGMDPFTYFLAFARLAPVQCVFFGHAETSGVRNIDYFISSKNIEPDNAQDHYSERLITLKSPCAYYYKPEVPAVFKPRSEFGLDDADHLYLCPQTFFKFHPDFDEILVGILHADPRGRLILKAGSEPHWVELLMQRLRRTMGKLVDRITVVPWQTDGDFINLLAVSDVMLDTLHFSGLTTSLEAFAVGTPIVTLPGEFQRGRLTLSLYHAMGMHDCVADSPAHYVDLAVRLGTDQAFRETIKGKILARNHVLYENHNVVTEYERFFLAALKASQVRTKKKAVSAGGSKKRRASADQK